MFLFTTKQRGPRRRQADWGFTDPWLTTLETRFLLAPIGYTPAQIVHAYGYDKVSFDDGGVAVPGDGRGETVAVFEVGVTPGLLQDLAVFDRAFYLPDLTSWTAGSVPPATPFLRTIGFDGGDSLAANQGDQGEALLDVEWLHAVAPGANILVVEAAQASELAEADAFAASQPGVVVVSNSYSSHNYLETRAEVDDNHFFTTPAGHPGVTFLDSSGDTGAPSHPPDFSPNVLSVGGTTLTLNATGNYGSETGWAGSGGGLSLYEPLPAYQRRAVPASVRRRAVPDVAIVANKNTGVQVYNPASGGWTIGGGTSLAAPLWAGIIAIADEGRATHGLGSLDGPTQTLPELYRLPRRDFHAITIGNNGFRAHRGYNLVTGLGSPYVNRVVAGLVGSRAVYRARRIGRSLRPPPSYFDTHSQILRQQRAARLAESSPRFDFLFLPGNRALSRPRSTGVTEPAPNSVPICLNPLGRDIFQVRTVLGSAGRKVFAYAGNYRIHAMLTVPGSLPREIVRLIRVAPAPLTVSSRTLDLHAGELFAGTVATFTDAGAMPEPTDPDAAAAYSAKIHWGDGTTSAGAVAVRSTAPGFIVTGRHAYHKLEIKAITISILEYMAGRRRPISFATVADVNVAKQKSN